jgi:hypothetical protein
MVKVERLMYVKSADLDREINEKSPANAGLFALFYVPVRVLSPFRPISPFRKKSGYFGALASERNLVLERRVFIKPSG